MTVLAITGGVGGAKLALGLSRILSHDEVVFLVNTGDDFEFHGLHISPDVDTLVYTLAEVSNLDTGWGRANDTWNFAQTLEKFGAESWFKLGDKDIALHVLRTSLLRQDNSLSAVTAEISRSFGISHTILPMSNDPVRTVVHTVEGTLPFQEYFVKRKCEPKVLDILYEGAESATLNPQLDLNSVSHVIFCPSNPFLSVGPLLALRQLSSFLQASKIPRVAVSPIVGGKALKGPTAKLMQEMGMTTSVDSIGEYYKKVINGLVIDREDTDYLPTVKDMGLRTITEQTIMRTMNDRIELAQSVLDFAKSIG